MNYNKRRQVKLFQKIEINSSTYGIGEVSKTESDEVNETADEALDKINKSESKKKAI